MKHRNQPQETKPVREAMPCRVLRLVRSIKYLGFINGFRYWKIESAMMRDPHRALVWASNIEAESITEGCKGNLQSSKYLMKFAAEVLRAHSDYILANTKHTRSK